MPSTYDQRFDWWRTQGTLEFEAYDLADNYSLAQSRTLPYLVNFRRWRLSYISRLRNLGYSNLRIFNAILRIYQRHGWNTIYDMIRYFRKQAIDAGEYTPIKKKSSHHKTINMPDGTVRYESGHAKGTGWSQGDRLKQKERRKLKVIESQREQYNIRIIRASAEGNQEERRRLEEERNKRFGY